MLSMFSALNGPLAIIHFNVADFGKPLSAFQILKWIHPEQTGSTSL